MLRHRMRAERRALANARPDASRHAAGYFLSGLQPVSDDIVALYFPIKDELDTEPLAAGLTEDEISIALPVVARRRAPLVFRAYEPGDALIRGAYGAKTPAEDALTVRPTIIVTPLLAFDRRGGRLGYGGGYYDRTLAALRQTGPVSAVGYAFADQEVDAVPVSPVDQPLDWIVTERGAIKV